LDEVRREEIKEAVKTYYAERARASDASGQQSSSECCGCGPRVEVQRSCCADVASDAPSVEQGAISLGCGDVLPFADIEEGQVVLDLGCGMGLEVIEAARRVGPTGRVIGLDMTPEMIERARRNAEAAGLQGVTEFRLGEMENLPVDDESVDWIISNCVINLSPDKDRVFQEAFRVLRPGGRILISDLVSSGLPEELKQDLASWAGCLGGTVEEAEYLAHVKNAGFDAVRVVDRADASALTGGGCCGSGPAVPWTIDSIRVKAVKTRR
jgi:arsenite methyltransferase